LGGSDKGVQLTYYEGSNYVRILNIIITFPLAWSGIKANILQVATLFQALAGTGNRICIILH
ncbi:hypothetical protein, partial [Litorimonas sp.]|uniref:hypothetical protein n=1 Tax=Litorimonas sp. TaxID=1892381 RepID=UPI003A850D90